MIALHQLAVMYITQVHQEVVPHLVPVFLHHLVAHVLVLLLNVMNVIWCLIARRKMSRKAIVKNQQEPQMKMSVNTNVKILVVVR